jgi:hypothetical protein
MARITALNAKNIKIGKNSSRRACARRRAYGRWRWLAAA